MPVTLREGIDALVAHLLEEAHLHGTVDRLGLVCAADAAHLGTETKETLHGHVRIQWRTFRQIADQAFCLDGILDDVMIPHSGHASGGRDVPGDHSHRGGFTCAVRPEEAKDFSPLDGERDVIHGDLRPEFLAQIFDFDHFNFVRF